MFGGILHGVELLVLGCVVGYCCRVLLLFGVVVHMRASGWTAVWIESFHFGSDFDPNPGNPKY